MRLILIDAHVLDLEAFVEHVENLGRDFTDVMILVRC